MPKSKKVELKKCPWCKARGKDLSIYKVYLDSARYVWCRKCNCHGPIGESRNLAIKAWNRRVNP
jgi:hypothetical protein